jgi:ABC-type lipoprotein export system ATPase subunit
MLERMGLSDLSRKVPDELSGGQSQRVGLARALVVRPALLLADEPTGQQDRAHALRLLGLLLEVAQECGTAVLVATHDASVADRFATRWSMSDGTLDTEGA